MHNADLAGRLDQRGEDRLPRFRIGDAQRALAASIGVIAVGLVTFHSLEEWQHISVAPAGIAHLRPGIEILRLAAHKRLAIDRA